MKTEAWYMILFPTRSLFQEVATRVRPKVCQDYILHTILSVAWTVDTKHLRYEFSCLWQTVTLPSECFTSIAKDADLKT